MDVTFTIPTVTILCVRDPDSSNNHTVSAEGVNVVVIECDFGSGMNSRSPRNEEEAEYAVELAVRLRHDVASLPQDDPVRKEAQGIADELLDDASEYIPVDDDVAYDDGKTLVAGALFDAETGEEIDDGEEDDPE